MPTMRRGTSFKAGFLYGGTLRNWCERGDSNPHGLPHWHLKPARLPVPPLSRSPTAASIAPEEQAPRGRARHRVRRTATIPHPGVATRLAGLEGRGLEKSSTGSRDRGRWRDDDAIEGRGPEKSSAEPGRRTVRRTMAVAQTGNVANPDGGRVPVIQPLLPRRPPRSGPIPGTPCSSARPPSPPDPRGSSAGSGAC